MKNFLFLVSLGLFLSCSTPMVEILKEEAVAPLNLSQLYAISWFQNSGESKALYLQGYALATYRLQKAIKYHRQHPRQKPLAVVLDIDETVLDNSPYNAGLLVKNKNYPLGWKEWCEARKAKAVPGVKNFLEYATQRNVEIFYVTNREEIFKDSTLLNLQTEGIPVKTENLLFRSAISNKEERRKFISSKYQIALLLGDNLNDFSDVFEKQDDRSRKLAVESLAKEFGSRFIVFPNPMYGDWEGGIYNYNWKLPVDEKLKIQIQKLESF